MLMANRPDWMTQMDERILDILSKTRKVKVDGLWLTPKSLALALPADRTYVNKRLSELVKHDLVETRNGGFYRITDLGYNYIQSNNPP